MVITLDIYMYIIVSCNIHWVLWWWWWWWGGGWCKIHVGSSSQFTDGTWHLSYRLVLPAAYSATIQYSLDMTNLKSSASTMSCTCDISIIMDVLCFLCLLVMFIGLILLLGTHTSHLECLCNVLHFWQSMKGCLPPAILPKLRISSSKTRSAMMCPMTPVTKASSVADSTMSSSYGLCGRKRCSALLW